MDAKVRKLIICYRIHSSRANIERLSVKKENCGRGLTQQEMTHKVYDILIKEYSDTVTDWFGFMAHQPS